jgi:hypothetical protein
MSGHDPWEGWNVIHVYTREQAIADGVLVDVSYMGRQVGIRIPVAVTQAVWAEYVAVPEGVSCQDEQGRLWDILWMFRFEAANPKNRENEMMLFTLRVRNDNTSPKEVTLKAICGPGDDGKPVLTILKPDED